MRKFLSDKVDIQLNHEPTMDELNGFDHVILAIGAHNMDLPMSVDMQMLYPAGIS